MARTVDTLRFGLVGPDLPDPHDRLKRAPDGEVRPVRLWDEYDIPVDFQQDNSCTGRAARKLSELCWQKNPANPPMRFSALYAYAAARPVLSQDNGAGLRDVALATVRNGMIPEEAWPGDRDPTVFPEDAQVWSEDRRYRLPSVERVLTWEDAKRVLSVERVGILTGIALQRNATDLMCESGFAPACDPADRVIGHHAEFLAAWDVIRGKEYGGWIGSWGTGVGRRGIYWRPAEYFAKGPVRDMWTVGKEFF